MQTDGRTHDCCFTLYALGADSKNDLKLVRIYLLTVVLLGCVAVRPVVG